MKLFFITIFVFILSTPSYASVKEVKKMVYKSEKYNLGLKKKDTTVNGLKLKPLMNKEAFENAVKKNYGWLDYGFNIVNAQEGEPVRWGDTSQRFELRIDDCGFIYKNKTYRDCIRRPPKHRFEVGQGMNNDASLGFKHGEEFWYTFSYYLPKDFKKTRDTFTIFQFHSDKGPYPPIFNIRVTSILGLTVDISTSQGAFNEDTNACGGSVKFKVNVCEEIQLKYIIEDNEKKINKMFGGKWVDFIIHTIWDNSPSDHDSNKGLFEVFINGKKKVHYEGQTAWDIGRAVVQYGIYEKKIPQYGYSYNDLKTIPMIAYYDEIWAKKKCSQLKLKRLGYSCKLLEAQSNEITKPSLRER